MAFLAPLVANVGPLLGAAGTVFSGVMAMQAGNYQQAVAEQNARIAEANARQAQERARIEAEDNDTLTLQMLGQQEAAQSASGVSLSTGSPVLTRKVARRLGRRDTLNIIHAGDMEAWNYQLEAANQRAAGQAAKIEGRANLLGSFLGAGGTLLGGAAAARNPNAITAGGYDPWKKLRRRT